MGEEGAADGAGVVVEEGAADRANVMGAEEVRGSCDACSDVQKIAAFCHAEDITVLVDEAHGAHLGLHPELPASALQQGADVVIQSTHKVLSSMTQSAMLHLQGPRVSPERIARSLQVLQSSSPSYVLMASLDAARVQVHADSSTFLEQAVRAAAEARQQLALVPGLRVLGSEVVGSFGVTDIDPTRVTISTEALELTGYEVDDALEELGIAAEIAGLHCITFAFSGGSTLEDARALGAAVHSLLPPRKAARSTGSDWSLETKTTSDAAATAAAAPPPLAQQVLPPREAFFAPTERVPAEQASGRVAAELLCSYPPGIPAVAPGEELTAAVILYLQNVLQAGGRVSGATDASLATFEVILRKCVHDAKAQR
ncbi:hypothetical protein CYMTET_12938 [Cymbomonas tetramitiformis]|uniref:Arginine decarboxylase n=1 Tax=Cymbomonas tetramitiformis TaxID=36881 RepID=A0AAE0GJK1_9CHLO|nr:hypothetical protein CYMTET_12938 [Cymbomonas tetramitiformis]